MAARTLPPTASAFQEEKTAISGLVTSAYLFSLPGTRQAEIEDLRTFTTTARLDAWLVLLK